MAQPAPPTVLDVQYSDGIDVRDDQLSYIQASVELMAELLKRDLWPGGTHGAWHPLERKDLPSPSVARLEHRGIASPLPPPWRSITHRVSYFKALQSWLGIVLDIAPSEIFVRLVDEDDPDAPELETSISLNEIDQEDQAIATPGAVFYWRIGYHDLPSGRTRSSMIRFRRLPAWTRKEIENARAEGERIFNLFRQSD